MLEFNVAISSLLGCPSRRPQCREGHQEDPFFFIACKQCLYSRSLWTVLTQHITSDWSVSPHTTRGCMQKNHIKGDLENTDRPVGQLLATHTTSEFSVLTCRNIQKHDVPCLPFRSTVCHIGWLPGHACIFSHKHKHYVIYYTLLYLLSIH